jgi:hypothetical protein
MRHCTPNELMAVADGSRDPASVPHLAVCDRCLVECEQLRHVLADVRDVAVPEPSPLYWEQLSARVRAAVAAERSLPPPEDDARWWHPTRLAWPATVAMAAVLAAVFVMPWLLTIREPSLHSSQGDSSAVAQVAAGSLSTERGPEASDFAPGSGNDESIGLMLELAGSLDFDAVLSAGLATTDGAADGAVADLSSDERSELARLIREALGGAGA